MASDFIRKLLGGKPAPSPQVEEALGDLVRLGKDRPALASPAALLADLLPILCAHPVRETPPVLTAGHAVAKLAGGVPLLRGETWSVDAPSFRSRWLEVCAGVLRHSPGEAAQAVGTAVRYNRLTPDDLVAELLAGRAESIHARADALGLDAGLTATVLRLTLFPVLAAVNTALASLRQGIRWEPGYCPTCGNGPLLGEFRGLDQTRFLRCGWCASEWEFPRQLCPSCGNRDHRALGYFHVEGEEARYRAATCDGCHGYVKMVSTLTALTGAQLLITDVATMHLDLAAAERGYGTGEC